MSRRTNSDLEIVELPVKLSHISSDPILGKKSASHRVNRIANSFDEFTYSVDMPCLVVTGKNRYSIVKGTDSIAAVKARSVTRPDVSIPCRVIRYKNRPATDVLRQHTTRIAETITHLANRDRKIGDDIHHTAVHINRSERDAEAPELTKLIQADLAIKSAFDRVSAGRLLHLKDPLTTAERSATTYDSGYVCVSQLRQIIARSRSQYWGFINTVVEGVFALGRVAEAHGRSFSQLYVHGNMLSAMYQVRCEIARREERRRLQNREDPVLVGPDGCSTEIHTQLIRTGRWDLNRIFMDSLREPSIYSRLVPELALSDIDPAVCYEYLVSKKVGAIRIIYWYLLDILGLPREEQ